MFYIIMTSMKKQVKASNIRLSIWIPTLRQDHYYEDTISNLNKLWRWEDNPEVEIITIENKLVNDARNEIVEKAKWEYILIINDDFSSELHPEKQFYRSEPIDFQRGELEWKGGNIYFNQWNYHLDINYLN